MNHKQIAAALHALSKEGYHLEKSPQEIKIEPQNESNQASDEGESRPRQEITADHGDPTGQSRHDRQNEKPWIARKFFAVVVCLTYWKPWKRIFFVAGIVGGVFYAYVTYRQWADLRHNFEIEQRAWMKVDIDEPYAPDTIDKLTTLSYPLVLSNVGRSPALGLASWYSVQIVKAEDPPAYIGTVFEYHSGVFFPSVVRKIGVQITNGSGAPIPVTDKQRKELIWGTSYLAVVGFVSYQDQFGNHYTSFCEWKSYATRLATNFGTNSCVAHNAVTDGTKRHNW